MTGFIDWSYKVDEIGDNGREARRTATAAERAQFAADLEILVLEALTADVTLQASGGGRYRLSGRIHADVTQACVVTTEPVSASIDESFVVEFWPPEDIGPLADGEHSVLEVDVPEPIENGRIAVGRIVYEQLAACLDPYPRKPDACFEGLTAGPGSVGEPPPHPFAALARLKDKR